MNYTKSPFQIARAQYQPKFPQILSENVKIVESESTQSVSDHDVIKGLFPNTYGMPIITFEKSEKQTHFPHMNVAVVLSGGQAPGGHNVIAGLFDGLKKLNPGNKLYGILGGPSGLIKHKYRELTAEIIEDYRNTGGFDIIGSDRTKLETVEQFEKCRELCTKLNIKAILIIGGDDSNTNAGILAEYYKSKGCDLQIIGCPKTIDGDLKNEFIETSFGFDTACKVYSELIGNIQRDANSAKKYWHFIRLMGRSASHIALECALQTQPNYAVISEEVQARRMSLTEIAEDIVNVIVRRGNAGMNFGTVLIPEGLIEFVPSVKVLIDELNDILADEAVSSMIRDMITDEGKQYFILGKLSAESMKTFISLPVDIARQLSLDRDSHGNVQVSLIETEKLLIEMVSQRLTELKKEGIYKGSFAALAHFLGYEGRCAAPSNFDTNYCYSLGYTASLLIANGKTGYMSCVRNLNQSPEDWIAGGVPITMLFNMEKKSGKLKPVIQKALVDLQGRPFKFFAENREQWAGLENHYLYPGPIQYFGPKEVCELLTKTLPLEHE